LIVSPVAVGSRAYDQGTMSTDDTISGIRRVDLQTRGPWRRRLQWWMGGGIAASKPALAILRRVAMPFEPTVMRVTRGRLTLSPTLPVVVLTSVGARSGERRDVPLAYFTDGDDVILIASNYGGSRHPAWYHNLRAHPECELHIGPRGGHFVAREVDGADRDRLYELAKDRLAGVFALHEKRSGDRAIPVMRLTPASLP
jgi:deazaflavin-dependent oxidoreductase (nitroreductase family)